MFNILSHEENANQNYIKNVSQPGVMVHTCNPSYSESSRRRIVSLRSVLAQ
jgi:hypothetical protein